MADVTEQEADVTSADENGRTRLHEACITRDLSAATSLLSLVPPAKMAAFVNTLDRHSRSALFYVCMSGDVELFNALMSHEAATRLQHVDRFGQTCLHHASMNNHLAVAELVLNNLTTPSHLELADPFRHTALLHAAKGGHSDVVAALLARGADVDATDKTGRTALHLSSLYDHRGVVAALLHHLGADPSRSRAEYVDRRDQRGHTAMMLACKKGLWQVVEELLGNEADPTLVDTKGRNCLHVACANGYMDVARVLLRSQRRGEFVNVRDKEGKSALCMARQKGGEGEVAMVALLKENGAEEEEIST